LIKLHLETFEESWQSRHSWELDAIAYLIGRSKVCDISLDLTPVLGSRLSKIHCCLFRRSDSAKDKYGKYLPPGYDLVDGFKGKPSSNGTYLNQLDANIVNRIFLRNGDVIYLSDRVRFIYTDCRPSATSELEDTLIDP